MSKKRAEVSLSELSYAVIEMERKATQCDADANEAMTQILLWQQKLREAARQRDALLSSIQILTAEAATQARRL